jgi:organic radical activating enzyme
VDEGDVATAQVFQNSVCNWRCWYCYVPFDLLAGDPSRSAWLTCDEMVNAWRRETDAPKILDLSGGQPDLTPEWVPWMMESLARLGLDRETYLWSDDNLSNDYIWRYLTDEQLALVGSYPHYGRVGCFKGYNASSFAMNTAAEEALFDRQFALFQRLATLQVDLYAYVTFTTASTRAVTSDIDRFVDRLQAIDEYLPLRTVPLEVQVFTPTAQRMSQARETAIENQWRVLEAWEREVATRFPISIRLKHSVTLGGFESSPPAAEEPARNYDPR